MKLFQRICFKKRKNSLILSQNQAVLLEKVLRFDRKPLRGVHRGEGGELLTIQNMCFEDYD